MVGLIISTVAALIAYNQATEAKSERKISEQLKKDIAIVAENTTKMAYVIADGTGRWGGMGDEHLQTIKQYENAMRQYLSPSIDTDIQNTIRTLDERIHK